MGIGGDAFDFRDINASGKGGKNLESNNSLEIEGGDNGGGSGGDDEGVVVASECMLLLLLWETLLKYSICKSFEIANFRLIYIDC